MATPWNKKDHFYQNSIDVLSSNDPEAYQVGENNSNKPDESEIRKRVYNNGLYRLIYLIRNKFVEKDKALANMWSLGGSAASPYRTQIPRWSAADGQTEDEDLNNYRTVGNYWGRSKSNNVITDESDADKGKTPSRDIQNTPNNHQGVFMLKISTNASSTGHMQQDYQVIGSTQRRYHRYGLKQSDNSWEWTPWLQILDTDTTGGDAGSADKVFLKKKNDATTGPISFGNPANSKNTEIGASRDIKITLSRAIYGDTDPTAHFGSNYTASRGQIYFQLEPSSNSNSTNEEEENPLESV